MDLFNYIERCNTLLSTVQEAGVSHDKIQELVAQSSFPGFVKYYAYQYLNLPYEQELDVRSDVEAQGYLRQIQGHYWRSPKDRENLNQLLILFCDYYAGTQVAQDAKVWQEQSWLSVVFNLCKSMVNYAVDHPVQTMLFFLMVGAASASAEKRRLPDGSVVVKEDFAPQDTQLFSTTDEEFTESDITEELTQLIEFKMRVDPALGKAKIAELSPKCEDAQKIVAEAVKREHQGHMVRVLANPRLSAIFCSDHIEFDGKKYLGLFREKSQSMYIDLNLTPGQQKATHIHEGMHADDYFRHTGAQCMSGPDSRIAPVHPANSVNIAKWNQAFDKGDARIDEFYTLSKRSDEGQVLNYKERKRLEKYTKALVGGGLVEHRLVSPDSPHYIALREQFSNSSAAERPLMSFELDKKEYKDAELVGIEKFDQDHHVYIVRTVNPAQSLFLQRTRTKLALSGPYAQNSPGTRLGERQAWTLMHLAPYSATIFYPEVIVLREKDIQKCDSTSTKGFSRDQRINIGLFFASPKSSFNKKEAALFFQESIALYASADTIPQSKRGFEKLARLPDWATQARFYLGYIAYFQKDYPTAIKHFSFSARKGVASLDSAYKAADSCFKIQDFVGAQQYAQYGEGIINLHWKATVQDMGLDAATKAKQELKDLTALITNELNGSRKQMRA